MNVFFELVVPGKQVKVRLLTGILDRFLYHAEIVQSKKVTVEMVDSVLPQ